MSFLKTFDELLAAVLTDYQGQFPEADLSQGGLIFIKSAVLASALWGIYRHQDWISKQIFPDTADSANLEHHAWVLGLTRRDGETDAELLSRLLSSFRQPAAGGNAGDYVQWARSVDGVGQAYCVPLAQGLGTVDVLVLASGESETPDQDLLDAVYDHIDALRPVTAHTMRVLAPTPVSQDVTMGVSGDGLSESALEAEIEVLLNSMEPGQTLVLGQLYAIAINAGASDVTITTPAANVEVDADEMIRPGTIDVTVA